tara:strand:+ start:246 stop:431 length:186 start_codon:yes stop_codon:yes gene_type:complete
MKYFLLIIFFSTLSCGYPDIDTVPNFESTIITKKELEDLCYMSNTDIKEIEECIKNIDIEK